VVRAFERRLRHKYVRACAGVSPAARPCFIVLGHHGEWHILAEEVRRRRNALEDADLKRIEELRRIDAERHAALEASRRPEVTAGGNTVGLGSPARDDDAAGECVPEGAAGSVDQDAPDVAVERQNSEDDAAVERQNSEDAAVERQNSEEDAAVERQNSEEEGEAEQPELSMESSVVVKYQLAAEQRTGEYLAENNRAERELIGKRSASGKLA
jgi:hypothetical protein